MLIEGFNLEIRTRRSVGFGLRLNVRVPDFW